MSTVRLMGAGKTRSCPHCKSTILESAAVCPGCQHHLRFDPAAAAQRVAGRTPMRVEGTIKPPASAGVCEYSVVLAIRNARGEEVARQVVGVGAIHPGDERTFSLSVEMFAAADLREVKAQADKQADKPTTRPAAVSAGWPQRPAEPVSGEPRTPAGGPAPDPQRPNWPVSPVADGARTPASRPAPPPHGGGSFVRPHEPAGGAPRLAKSDPAPKS